MQQPAVTDAELVDALSRRRRGLPPPPSQSFTVHEEDYIHDTDPTFLYGKYGGGGDSSDSCVYFFGYLFNYEDWSVAAGTQPVLDGGGGGAVIGWKDTLVFHEGRWLLRARWAMDEFTAEYHKEFRHSKSKYSDDWLRLYRLRRLDP